VHRGDRNITGGVQKEGPKSAIARFEISRTWATMSERSPEAKSSCRHPAAKRDRKLPSKVPVLNLKREISVIKFRYKTGKTGAERTQGGMKVVDD
jgi:hypothetical protein